MFKSIEYYKFTNNTTGITITGPGVVSILQGYGSQYNGSTTKYYNGYVVVDGHSYNRCDAGSMFMFKNSLKLYTESSSSAVVEAVVGLFN